MSYRYLYQLVFKMENRDSTPQWLATTVLRRLEAIVALLRVGEQLVGMAVNEFPAIAFTAKEFGYT